MDATARSATAPPAAHNSGLTATSQKTAPRPPKVDPYEHLPPFPTTRPHVYYARVGAEADRIAAHLMLAGGPIGFDIEWRPNWKAGIPENKVALVQLAARDVVLLAQVIAMPTFPPVLKSLLESSEIVKTGVGIQADAVKLYNDYGVVMHCCVDVGSLALTIDTLRWEAAPPPPKPESETQASSSTSQQENSGCPERVSAPAPSLDTVGGKRKRERPPRPPRDPNAPPPLSQPGLARLIGVYLQLHMKKPKMVQRSNWELILSPEQQEYAANDACAGRFIYAALKDLAATLTPPEKADSRAPQFFSFDVFEGNIFFRLDDAYGIDESLARSLAAPALPPPAPITSAFTPFSFVPPTNRTFVPTSMPVPNLDAFPRLAGGNTFGGVARTAAAVDERPGWRPNRTWLGNDPLRDSSRGSGYPYGGAPSAPRGGGFSSRGQVQPARGGTTNVRGGGPIVWGGGARGRGGGGPANRGGSFSVRASSAAPPRGTPRPGARPEA